MSNDQMDATYMEVGDDGMELGERDPNRCEILCGERCPSLVGETRMLFEVISRRSEEATGDMSGCLKKSGTITTYDDWNLEEAIEVKWHQWCTVYM